MCFSFGASVAAGVTLTVAGGLTLTMARRRAELPLASVPLLFGVQQLVEAAVWWSLEHGDARLGAVTTAVYMLFSHVLWPLFVPFALRCLEVVRWRRRTQAALLALGAAVALHGLVAVVGGAITARVVRSSIQYDRPGPVLISCYLLATSGAALTSSRWPVRLIGSGSLGLALVALWLYAAVFVSVWCFFCAVLALGIAALFWSARTARPATTPIGRAGKMAG